jgi:hypothetical protein
MGAVGLWSGIRIRPVRERLLRGAGGAGLEAFHAGLISLPRHLQMLRAGRHSGRPRSRLKIGRARRPATAFFSDACGRNPRISGVSARPMPARVPSCGEVSRRGAIGTRDRRGFSGHFRTSRSGISGGRRAVRGHGGGRVALSFRAYEVRRSPTTPHGLDHVDIRLTASQLLQEGLFWTLLFRVRIVV